ncbi:MAG: FtsH protease activity modulator HflK [Robiginitomaculum sp.]
MPNNNSPWDTGGGKGGKDSGGRGTGGRGNSPWGSSGSGKGGKKPNRNRPTNDLDNVIRDFKGKFGSPKKGDGGLGGGRLPLIIGAAIILALIMSSIFTVDQQEEAVVLRFGEYQRTVGAGLNFKLPYPIEQIIIEKTREIKKIDIGGNVKESEMLTGDENIVEIDFSVLWRINNLQEYLFDVKDPDTAVRAVAESAMREVIGNHALEGIITKERLSVTTDVKKLMQETLNEYKTGVQVVEVQLQKAYVPPSVIASFRDVVNAAQDAETAVNKATEHANKIIPEAEGTALKLIQEAEGYRGKEVAEARGQAERFKLVYKEYKAAPRVTRQRMYLETMEQVYEHADKMVLDGKSSGVVPYLSLDELKRKGAK